MIENNVLTIEYDRGVLTLNMDHAFKVFNQSDMKILSDTIKKCDDPEAVAAEVNGYLVDVIEKLTKARDNIYDGNDQGKKDRARLNKDIKHYVGLQNILVKHFNIEALEKDQEATATAKECESYIFENNVCIRKEKAWKLTKGGYDFIIYMYNNRYYVRIDGIIPCVVANKRSKAEAIRDISADLLSKLDNLFKDQKTVDNLRKQYAEAVKAYEDPETTEAEPAEVKEAETTEAETIQETEPTAEVITDEAEAITENAEAIEPEDPPEIIQDAELINDQDIKEPITRIDKHKRRAKLDRAFFHKVARRAKYDIRRLIAAAA